MGLNEMGLNEIRKIEKSLHDSWNRNLKNLGVKYPSGAKLNELICLYENLHTALSQDEIEQWFSNYGLEYKRQARHLADLGWDIRSGNSRFTRGQQEKKLKRNQLVLYSIKNANPLWNKENKKRINNLSINNWNEILEIFKDRGCAVCGRSFDSYDKGHLDRKKAYEKGNIVPMCSDCNNWGQAKDCDFELKNNLVARPKI